MQTSIDITYNRYQNHYEGYLSPQQCYPQAFQDTKNITFLILGEYLRYGRNRPSTPEILLKELSDAPNIIMEGYWRIQDSNLQSFEKIIMEFLENGVQMSSELPPLKLTERNLGIQIFPYIDGDILCALEFKRLVRDIEMEWKGQENVSMPILRKYDPEKEINLMLHRPKIIEDFNKSIMEEIFPLAILLKVVEFYRNYLMKCAPVIQNMIDRAPISHLLDLFRYLFQKYYYSIFEKIDLAQLGADITKANLDQGTLDQLIFDPTNFNSQLTSGIEPLQLRPLFKKNGFIYINGNILLEAFLCHIDNIFKSEVFRNFKGLILEYEAANILYEFDLQSYNIILSKHPQADSNPRYIALLVRDAYPLYQRYKNSYKTPHRVHLQFTNASFFKQYSFVEFDVCFIANDTLVVLECKNQPIYSRRDFINISVLDAIRQLARLHNSIVDYLFEPQVKVALNKKGLTYSHVKFYIITPGIPFPWAINISELYNLLESLGFKPNKIYSKDHEDTILENFDVDPDLLDYESPLYSHKANKKRKRILGEEEEQK